MTLLLDNMDLEDVGTGDKNNSIQRRITAVILVFNISVPFAYSSLRT